ncbi:division/cell wall cluster transcriptional repressor MraZ [Sphingosinicella ginsenosidimutans]|uniref:division/cell wall cluster transcriptional repressor MraZ n=1 Tax=Allosphingosinicella ginsenosidimutans TaxID=1176539 RepID=UPI00131566F5|nr:division/cell wall cluster transcriptional repressor MraZ [Sphingosinicella ginsenosidimutans]
MAVEHLFRGNALNAVDAKGRLSVPAFIRAKIERRSDERLIVLAPHEAYPCLVGYDSNFDAEIYAENERRRLAEEGTDPTAHFERAHRAFGAAEEAPYDSSGRIILPQRMRSKGKIEDLALFVGVGATFEVWNPRVAAHEGGANLREIALYWLEERGIAP